MIEIDFTTKPKITHEYIIDHYGTKRLYDENGQLHSYNDLPATISPAGSKFWYKHGKRHRDNGLPAVISKYGLNLWCQNGKLIARQFKK